MLTAIEEVDLATQAQNGDSTARDLMIEQNLPLVRYHAKRYLHMGHNLTIDDLMQEGCIGMLHAVRQYNPKKGRFGTYASLWIKQAIRFAIYSNWGPLKVPIWTRKYLPQFREARDALTAQTGMEPTSAEIGLALGIGSRKAGAVAQAEATLALWHAEEGDGEEYPSFDDMLVGHTPEALHLLITMEDIEQVLSFLDRIPDREAAVVRLRYGLDGQGSRTLAVVGQTLGITRERTRQIEQRAMRMLRGHMEARDEPTREVTQEIRDVVARTVKNRRWMKSFSVDRVLLRRSIRQIPEKYSFVLRLRYYVSKPVTFVEIAKQLGFSLTYIMQLEQQGIERIRGLDEAGHFDSLRQAG